MRSINYNVDCVAGTIYLMGVAQDQAELQRVIDHARDISYVRNVVSFVRLKNDPARQQTSTTTASPPQPPRERGRKTPIARRPSARLSAFGAAPDGDIDLAEAALLLGSFDRPEVDLDDCRRRLGDLVHDLAGERERWTGGAATTPRRPLALIARHRRCRAP